MVAWSLRVAAETGSEPSGYAAVGFWNGRQGLRYMIGRNFSHRTPKITAAFFNRKEFALQIYSAILNLFLIYDIISNMNEAKVGVFDDNKPIRELLRQILEIDSHRVVVEAARVQEAIAIIEAMEEGDIDVALVDGNLDGPERGGKDGESIASLLREKFSRVVVIGISSSDAIVSRPHKYRQVQGCISPRAYD